jgi:hypothetical protein
MRGALYATAIMNLAAGLLFLPGAGALRALAGFPAGEHAIYLATVALFVLLFGGAYLAAAVMGRADRLFITMAAIGKLGFVAVVTACWAAGALSGRAPLVAAADVVFGVLFLAWVLSADAERS